MSKPTVAHEQPPQRAGFAPLPNRHYRRIAKEKDWEARVAHHRDIGYRIDAELGTCVLMSCDSDERRVRQQSAEQESQARTLAKLAATEPGFMKREDSLQLQKVTTEQMEQAMALHESLDANG